MEKKKEEKSEEIKNIFDSIETKNFTEDYSIVRGLRRGSNSTTSLVENRITRTKFTAKITKKIKIEKKG